jgi:hypothetical protein
MTIVVACTLVIVVLVTCGVFQKRKSDKSHHGHVPPPAFHTNAVFNSLGALPSCTQMVDEDGTCKLPQFAQYETPVVRNPDFASHVDEAGVYEGFAQYETPVVRNPDFASPHSVALDEHAYVVTGSAVTSSEG